MTGKVERADIKTEEAGTERRTQQQRREETRKKLIDAAKELIRRKGAASLTTAQVAKTAGLTRGAIQYHFTSPKDLLREVVVDVVEFLNFQVRAENLQILNKEERLDRLVDLYWQGYKSDTYVVFIEIAVQGRRDPELRQTIEDALRVLERSRDEHWLSLFHDYPDEDRKKLSWRTTLLIILRGLAVKQMFASPGEDMDQIFLQTKEMYKKYISGGPPPISD